MHALLYDRDDAISCVTVPFCLGRYVLLVKDTLFSSQISILRQLHAQGAHSEFGVLTFASYTLSGVQLFVRGARPSFGISAHLHVRGALPEASFFGPEN